MTVRNISIEELRNLLERSCITINDRFLLDSYVNIPLVEYYNDIKPNEVERVRILEEKNLYRYLNATCIVLGIYGRDTLVEVLAAPPFSTILSILKEEYSGRELEKNFIVIMAIRLLALGGSQTTTPIFEGEMPQKFMSFRNQTANKWFGEIVPFKLAVLSTIYEKSSWEEAKSHLFSSIAYQLHHSNPTEYIIDTSMSMNDALSNILIKFINKKDGNLSILHSKSGEILSKVL